jgi:hypothetical protein
MASPFSFSKLSPGFLSSVSLLIAQRCNTATPFLTCWDVCQQDSEQNGRAPLGAPLGEGGGVPFVPGHLQSPAHPPMRSPRILLGATTSIDPAELWWRQWLALWLIEVLLYTEAETFGETPVDAFLTQTPTASYRGRRPFSLRFPRE